MSLDYYKKINGTYLATTNKEVTVNDYRDALSGFEDSINYEVISVENSTYGVLIVEANSMNPNEQATKTLISKSNNIFNVGSTFEFLNENWIILRKDPSDILYNRYLIKQCNNVLTFQLTDKSIKIIPCIFKKSVAQSGSDTQENQFLSYSDSIAYIKLPDNQYTRQLKIDKRIIFNNFATSVYTIVNLDISESDGIMDLKLQRTQYNQLTDRLDLNVADYISTDIPNLGGYSVVIDGLTSVIAVGADYEYTVKVFYNNSLDTTKSVNFTVNNTSLATVTSQNGVKCTIKTNANGTSGIIKLKATMTSFPSIFDEHIIEIRKF